MKHLCLRCKELDSPIEDCSGCEHLADLIRRKKVKVKPDHYKDDNGVLVPARLNAVFAAVEHYRRAERQLNALAKTFKAIEDSPAKEAKSLEKTHFEKFYGFFKNARWRARMMRPSIVCPRCEGEGCVACTKKGWMTLEERNIRGI